MQDKNGSRKKCLLKARSTATKANAKTAHRYTIMSLQQQLVGLQQEAVDTRLLYELTLHREQVLLDLVAHQELVLSLLYCEGIPPSACQSAVAQATPGLGPQAPQLTAAPESSHGGCLQDEADKLSNLSLGSAATASRPSPTPSSNMQQQQQQQSPAAAVALASEDPLQLPCYDSYVSQLLRGASQCQVDRVLHMTAADWSAFFQQSFAKLVVLLELCRRGEYITGDPQPPPTASAAATADPISSQGHCCLASHPSISSAAAAAVPAGLSAVSDWQQLSLMMDEWVTLSALALLLNPIPVYMATTINHATQQHDSPPPGYWQSVVHRLKLTGWQVLHFHLALEELARLDKVTVAQNEALAADAGCPSTLVLAAHAELCGSATAAAAGGDANATVAAAAVSEDVGEADNADDAAAPTAAAAAAAAVVVAQPGKMLNDDLQGDDEQMLTVAVRQQEQQQQQRQEEQQQQHYQQQQDDSEEELHVKAEVMLQRKVQKLPLQAQLMLAFNCNTLTKMQLAQVLVYSYPFIPMTMQVAAAAAQLYDEQLLLQGDLDIPLQDRQAVLVKAAAAAAAATGDALDQAANNADEDEDAQEDEEGEAAQQRRPSKQRRPQQRPHRTADGHDSDDECSMEAAAAAAAPSAAAQPTCSTPSQYGSYCWRQQQQQIWMRKLLLQRQQQLWWWEQQGVPPQQQ